MNCFQIIKSVLDEAYNDIEGSESEKNKLIDSALNFLSSQYSDLLSNTGEIDYSDPITRFAYIYVYVTSHANMVCSLIDKNSDLSVIFDKDEVDIACIGGGPGSDFLGILKYLMLKGKSPDVSFQILDREKAWLESWSDVDRKVDRRFHISTSYLPLDVTDREDWGPHRKYLQADLFTMIYFMSEVLAFRDSADAYFKNLFETAKKGALFLFVDNRKSEFYGWFDDLAEEHGIEILKRQEFDARLPTDEDKRDLGEYFDKFAYQPKLRSSISYRIGRKP